MLEPPKARLQIHKHPLISQHAHQAIATTPVSRRPVDLARFLMNVFNKRIAHNPRALRAYIKFKYSVDLYPHLDWPIHVPCHSSGTALDNILVTGDRGPRVQVSGRFRSQ